MRLPRDLSGDDLVRSLGSLGYITIRQSGSHIRMVTTQHGEHHVTVPRKESMRVGTLAAILGDVAEHFGLTREDLISKLFTK